MDNIINKRIKEARTRKDLTLLEVATKLGVSEATVQRYESGDIKNIKHKTIIDLSNIFDCTPAYLMGWEDEPQMTKDELEEIEIKTIAAHAVGDLSEESIKKIIEYAKFIKAQEGKKE